MYYLAIIVDPIIRFNWILYAITPLHIQHSALTSFFVSLSEVFRRGLWSLFRVENEHCSNVGHFRASRDVPLPYDIPPSPDMEGRARLTDAKFDEEAVHPQFRRTTTAPDLDLGPVATGADSTHRTPSSRRRRAASFSEQEGRPSPLARGLTRIGSVMRNAHAQDFEKKKKPELGAGPVKDDDSDDDDDDEQTGSASESARGEGGTETEDEAEILAVRDEIEIGRAGGSGSG
jgi:hypothetical protein